MDLNYLFFRQQVERSMAASADSDLRARPMKRSPANMKAVSGWSLKRVARTSPSLVAT